ncbi:hypothetical protein NIES4103_13620 [Nostoc sp. NIES-4103]|nr:hypothetical protein NIES4103_13620 [Nostoc sp. NIES-4103]
MFKKYYAKHQSHSRPNPLTPFPTRKGGIQSLSTFRGEEWKRGFEYTLRLSKHPLSFSYTEANVMELKQTFK